MAQSTRRVRNTGRHVIAAVDGPPAEEAVLQAAKAMGGHLDAAVRPVRVRIGGGLRGEARAGALRRVARGESADLVGRPETLLAALAGAPDAVLTVMGTRRRPARARGRRASGTAVSVARRIERPLLLVPADATGWGGPSRVLTVLDGTGETAMAAACALAQIGVTGTDTTAVHLGDGAHPRPDDWGRHTSSVSNGRRVLEEQVSTDADLVVMVWTRRSSGCDGRAVLDVLTRTPVPVLLVPAVRAAHEN